MFDQKELLPKLLNAIGLWPAEDYVVPWCKDEIRRNVLEAMGEMGERRMVVVLWVAVLLGLG